VQYTYGTVQFNNGGAKFISDTTADWSDAQLELTTGKSVWIKVLGSALVYEVTLIEGPPTTATHVPPNRWEANIVGTIGDATAGAGNYVLVWNFTAQLELPIPNPGDVDVAAIMARAFAILDTSWTAAPSGSDAGQSYLGLTIGSGATVTVSQTKGRQFVHAVLTDSNPVTIVLSTTGRTAGNMCFFRVDWGTGFTTVVNFRNGSSGGALVAQLSGTSLTRGYANLVYDGTAWYYNDSGFTYGAPIVGGPAGGGQTYQSIAITGTGNNDSGQTVTGHRIKATIAAGSGVYTATITLLSTGRTAGDECRISMAFPASVNPTVQVRNASPTGAILWSYNPADAVARNWWANFVFDGSTWYLDSDGLTT
jgi:hypothetical protein